MSAQAANRLDLAPTFNITIAELNPNRFSWIALYNGHQLACGVATTRAAADQQAQMHDPRVNQALQKTRCENGRRKVEDARVRNLHDANSIHTPLIGQTCPWPRMQPHVHYQSLSQRLDTGRVYSGRYRDLLKLGADPHTIIALDSSAPAPIGPLWGLWGVSRNNPDKTRLYDYFETRGAARRKREELLLKYRERAPRFRIIRARRGVGSFSDCILQYETWVAYEDGKLTAQDLRARYREVIRRHGQSLLALVEQTIADYGYACIGTWSGAKAIPKAGPRIAKSVDNTDLELTASLAQCTDSSNVLLDDLYRQELEDADQKGRRPEPELPEGCHALTYQPGAKLAAYTGPDPDEPRPRFTMAVAFSHRHLASIYLESKGRKVVQILPPGASNGDWWTDHQMDSPYQPRYHSFQDCLDAEVPSPNHPRAADGPKLRGLSLWEVQQWMSQTLTDLKVLPEIRNR